MFKVGDTKAPHEMRAEEDYIQNLRTKLAIQVALHIAWTPQSARRVDLTGL